MSDKKSNSKMTQAAILVIIGIAVLVFVGQGTSVNRIGLELVLNYADGSSRAVYAPVFAEVKSLQTVWDGGRELASIDSYMLLQNSIAASSFTYACAYEAKIDGVVKKSGTINDNVGSGGNVHNALLISVLSSEILGWTGSNNGTHEFELNVPVGSTLTAQTSEGQKVFTYNGQRVTLSLRVEENVSTTNPPENPPPEQPPPGTASITLYTKVWNAASNTWEFQGNVPVTVSWGTGSSTWLTGVDGYMIVDGTPPGTYSFSATFESYSNSTSVTVVAGDVKSVTLYFGSGTPSGPSYLFSDGFESGDLSKWSGNGLSAGETVSIVNTLHHSGTYSANYAANGGGGYETAYTYWNLANLNDVYARGYFYVATSGIATNYAGFYFLTFRTGVNTLAYAGWKMQGGQTRWYLETRNDTGYVDSYSVASPSLSQWYIVELHWIGNAVNGHAELYVNGALTLSITGFNTASYGAATSIRVGLAELNNCGATAVYGDDIVVNTSYIGP